MTANTRRRFARQCAAAGALGVALLLGCGSAQSGVDRALQRMRDQPRAGAYGASPVFPDGMVMRAPPAGTVSREQVTDGAAATGRDASGRYLDHVAPPVTAELLARGRSRFRIFCGACHGAGGFGGSVVAENLVARRPPSLRTGVAAALPPGLVYEVIRAGFGRMPSYAGQLPEADRWAIVAYVLSLRDASAADSAERDDSVRAAALRLGDSLRAASTR